ncbi:hypothetical protein [Leucobacter sp. Z1108]
MGLEASASIGHYSVSQRGVVGLMLTLALELAPEFIRVNSYTKPRWTRR